MALQTSPSRGSPDPHLAVNPSLVFAETVDFLVHADTACASDPFELDKARLYVMPVCDGRAQDGPSADIVLLDEDENPYRLLRRTRHHLPIIAGCVVATGWCAPFGLDDEANACAPSEHPMRQRVRLTVAVTDAGIASVLRRSDDPDVVHPLPSRGMGDLPDVLDAWWREK